MPTYIFIYKQVHNYRRVIEGVDSLADLFVMSEAQLASLLDSPAAARILFKFINQLAPV
jgi:hypothetical protein